MKQLLLPFLFLTASFLLDFANAICTNRQITIIGQCIKPLAELWTRYKDENPEISQLSFPLFKYSRTELLFLCDGYRRVQESCLSDNIRRRCAKNRQLSFATSLLDYACGVNSWKFFKHQECIAGALKRADHCYNLIRIGDVSTGEKRKCKNISEFFVCAQGAIEAECDADAVTVIRDAIIAYGCEVEPPAQCDGRSEDTVSICVGPMIERWRQLDTINGHLEINVFPLFLYTPTELETICSIYQNTRTLCLNDNLRTECRTDMLIRFVESNLHYACNLNDDDKEVFQRNFACISNVLQRGSGIRCTLHLRGRAAPGPNRDKCDNMPAFYACTKRLVAERCSSEAVGIIEEAIDAFGCETGLSTPLPDNPCEQPVEPGPCNVIQVRWAYSEEHNGCTKFAYGGCKGNKNNFVTEDECQKTCGGEPSETGSRSLIIIGGAAAPKTTTTTVASTTKKRISDPIFPPSSCPPIGSCRGPECFVIPIRRGTCKSCVCAKIPQ